MLKLKKSIHWKNYMLILNQVEVQVGLDQPALFKIDEYSIKKINGINAVYFYFRQI